jgi:hypothetical protein
VFDFAENQTGTVGVIATDIDGATVNNALEASSSITFGLPSTAPFELVQVDANGVALGEAGYNDDNGVSLELRVAAGGELDFEDQPSYTLDVDVTDGAAPTQTVSFVVNVLDVPETGDDYEAPITPITAAWTPADDGALIFRADLDSQFPKTNDQVVYSVSGQPTWLNFQSTTQTFWALPGSSGVPTSTTTINFDVVATFFDDNGVVQGTTDIPFELDVIVAMNDAVEPEVMETLDILEEEALDALPEDGQMLQVQDVLVAQAPAEVPAEVDEFADALAMLEADAFAAA